MSKITEQSTQWVTSETHWQLEQWARWAAANSGVSLGYPSATPARRLLGASISAPLISDDEGMALDAQVSQLRHRNPPAGDAVALYYLCHCTTSRVAAIMGIYHSKADLLIKSGSAWLDGRLSSDAAA